jgi:hypothetical protein
VGIASAASTVPSSEHNHRTSSSARFSESDLISISISISSFYFYLFLGNNRDCFSIIPVQIGSAKSTSVMSL